MAGRGGPKLKEYRQHVTSVRQWLKEIEYEGLIICEVYCGAFGNCQVILPSINSIMLSIDDSEDKMKWLVINVAKLEEEQRHLLAEEEKKKIELESVQRRKALNDKDGEGGNEDGSHSHQLSSSALHAPAIDEEETAAKIKTAWDKITIPKLEKYSGYDHPRPLWLLMKDGQVLYELNSANPPKLTKMVTSILTNVPLTEKELLEMDFHPDPAAKKKRKKKPSKKTAAEAAREARKKKLRSKLSKPEVIRPEEYLIQTRIANIHKNVAENAGKHPLLVLYVKDAASDDFTYYGQTERIRGDLNPVYHKSFSFLKSDVQPQIDAGGDIELKFVLYDSESDTISKDHPPTILGDAYCHLKSLIGDGEGSVVDLKLKKHMPHPPTEKKSARKKADEHKEEEDESEHGAGLLTLITKNRSPEGVVTNYRINLAAKQLPSLNKDGPGVAEVQPETVNPDGSPIDPALIDEASRRDYFIEFQLSDENSLRPASIGITETEHVTSDPVFSTSFHATHHTRDNRTLTFLLYDGLIRDDRIFDGLTNGVTFRSELIATASIRYDIFLTQRKQFKNEILLPWLDSTTGEPLNGGASSLKLSADEYLEDGTIDPFDPDEDELLFPKEILPEKLEVALSIGRLQRSSETSKQPLIAVFVQTTTGAFEFLGSTERAQAQVNIEGEQETNIAFKKVFLFNAPKAVVEKKPELPEEISADTSYAAFSAPSSSANATPRPGSNRTNIYKFVLYDSDSDDYSKGSSEVIGESTIELSKELLSMGSTHSLTLLDKSGTPFPSTSIDLNIEQVGSVTTYDLVVSAGGLVKIDTNSTPLPNPQIKLFTTHKSLQNENVLAGETEKMMASTDPSFLGKIQVDSYSSYSSQVTVVVYDSPEIGSSELEHIIGEVSFPLQDFLNKSNASVLTAPSGQTQPIEYKLTKLVPSQADPTINERIEVNGGLAFIRLYDITPKPVKRQRKIGEDGEELSDDEDEPENAIHAAAVAAAAEAAEPKELSKEERESGTSPSMTDGTKISLSISAQDIPKSDWLNDKYPFIALYKKVPSTGLFEFQDCTERIRNENDPKWQKIFILDNPQGSQLYKLILLDVQRDLSMNEMGVWSQASNISRLGVGSHEKYDTLVRNGGDADHLGEWIFDLQNFLLPSEIPTITLQDRFGKEVKKTILKCQASEIGTINPLQLNVTATGLPKSELFNKTDPIVILAARNPNTGEWNELTRTERLIGSSNPHWSTPLPVDGYSKADRELRLAVYDSDSESHQQSFTEKDLLGESSTTLNGLLVGSVELKLTKGGKPVIVGDVPAVLTVRAAARGGPKPLSRAASIAAAVHAQTHSRAPSQAGSRAPTRPGSAAAVRPTSAAPRPASAQMNVEIIEPAADPAAAAVAPAEPAVEVSSLPLEHLSPVVSSSRPTSARSRPLSASQKLEANLSARHAEEAAAAIAHAEELQAAATPASLVAETLHHAPTAEEQESEASAHASAGATTAMPAPEGLTSATGLEGAQ